MQSLFVNRQLTNFSLQSFCPLSLVSLSGKNQFLQQHQQYHHQQQQQQYHQKRNFSFGKMSIEKAKESFFNAEHYAVVGASTDRAKYGNKVLRWYKDHGFEVIPVHPKESSVEDISTISDIKQVQNPTKTSLSIITPPKISLSIIQSALQDLHVNAVWLQPGAEDQEVKDWIASTDESTQNKVIYGGPCILVQGESLAKAKGKL